MKIAVTATEPSLDAAVDPQFGRCCCFVLADAEQGTFEALDNTNADTGGGAGIQAAQMIAAKGANALLTGSCGPDAFRTLSAAGIRVILGCSGTVRDVIEQYKSAQRQPVSDPNVPAHFGTDDSTDDATPESQTAPGEGGPLPLMSQGQRMGGGQGMGRGGRGRGAGGGMRWRKGRGRNG